MMVFKCDTGWWLLNRAARRAWWSEGSSGADGQYHCPVWLQLLRWDSTDRWGHFSWVYH